MSGATPIGRLAILLFFFASTMPGQSETSSYSRSAIILRNLDRMEFSGGVIPNTGWQPPVFDLPIRQQNGSVDRGTRRPRRVNADLLDTETVQQPGTQAEPYIHANPNDPKHVVAGWQENRFSDGGAQALNVAVSFDGGRSWEETVLPGLTLVSGGPWERASDPWVEFGPTGEVYFSSLLFNQTSPDNAIGVSRSTDGGRSWSRPVEVFASLLDFNDKEALTVDTFSASPHYKNVYVAWDVNVSDATGQNFLRQELLISRSTDGGETFRRPRRVRSGPTNVGVVPRVGPDGTVYLVWTGRRAGDPNLYIYFSRSRNGGQNWRNPRIIENLASVGINNIRSGNILTSFAVDPVNGDLFVAWQDARWTGVDQATSMVSRDGGNSWSAPRLVSKAPPNAPTFTVSTSVNRQGQVAVSYYSLQRDPSRSVLVDRYIRISADGGETFGRAIRTTRKTFDIRFAAQARGFFLGDYVGLVGADESFYQLWISTRRRSAEIGSRQPDAWASRTR